VRMHERSSEELLWQSLEQVPGCVFWKDAEGRYLGCNEEFTTMIGVKKEAVIGKTDFEIEHLSKRASHYLKQDQEIMRSGRPRWAIHETYYNQADHPVRMIANKKPLIDSLGNVVGIIGLCLPEEER